MKLAEVTTADSKVTMWESGGWYSVHAETGYIQSWDDCIATREDAERSFLWHVGYPIWRREQEAAFNAARRVWSASHTTLESVGAKVYSNRLEAAAKAKAG